LYSTVLRGWYGTGLYRWWTLFNESHCEARSIRIAIRIHVDYVGLNVDEEHEALSNSV